VKAVRFDDRAGPPPHRLQLLAPGLQFHPHRSIPSLENRN
jgi:hypothetical protein